MKTGIIYMVKSHAREINDQRWSSRDGNLCYKKMQCRVSLKSECIKGCYDDEINEIQNVKKSVRKGTDGFFNSSVQGEKEKGLELGLRL